MCLLLSAAAAHSHIEGLCTISAWMVETFLRKGDKVKKKHKFEKNNLPQ